MKSLRFPAILFYAASLFGLAQIYYAIEGLGWRLSVGALVYGLILGFLAQLFFDEPLPKRRVATAAFLGALTLWLPVVLVTYGFALAATPVLIAYAAAAAIGAYAAVLLRKVCAVKNAA
jgi:hypothetical protein